VKPSFKKETKEELDSDEEYDFVERVVTTKKRKRVVEGGASALMTSKFPASSAPPKRKRTRKQSNPVEKVPTASHPDPIDVKLPSSSLKKSTNDHLKKPVANTSERKAKLTYTDQDETTTSSSLTQDPEEDFLQEKNMEEEAGEMLSNGRMYADDILY